jgi:hypothetical protein
MMREFHVARSAVGWLVYRANAYPGKVYELYADAQQLAIWLNDRAQGYPKRNLPYPPDSTRAELWATRYG